MATEELTTKVETANDPAKELGTLETWNGQDVYVVRNAKGHFVTWRKVSPAETDSAPVAVADGGQDEVTFTTERGADVTVTAENGTLFVGVESPAINIDRTSAFVETYKGIDVLNLGVHRVQGDRQKPQIPVGENKDEIEQLREDSEPEPTDELLAYEEKDQDALEESAEIGEEVVISKTTTYCNDSSKECNLDHVTRVATPEGEIETRRTHTY
jgi:hypothetical protein